MPVTYSLESGQEKITRVEKYTYKKRGKKAQIREREVEDYISVPTWNIEKKDPNTGYMNPSHESEMDGAEVVRLTKEGVALLTTQAIDKIQKTNDAELLKLYNNLKSERTVPVTITKGIHQRNTKPHITARLIGEKTFHIWLSTNAVPGRESNFVWKAIGISATSGGALMPPCVVQGVRQRSGSISHEVLIAGRT